MLQHAISDLASLSKSDMHIEINHEKSYSGF